VPGEADVVLPYDPLRSPFADMPPAALVPPSGKEKVMREF
jgi:hypothetical protein